MCARLAPRRTWCVRGGAAAAARARPSSALAPAALRLSYAGVRFGGVRYDRGYGGVVAAGSRPAVAADELGAH